MRPMTTAAAAYQQSRILSSTPEQLVVLLYEHLLINLRRAGTHIDRGELEEKGVAFERANDAVFELIASLNVEAAGELSSRLAALYSYFIAEIGAISRTLDTARLRRLTALIASLHESWVAAARTVAAGAEPETGAA